MKTPMLPIIGEKWFMIPSEGWLANIMATSGISTHPLDASEEIEWLWMSKVSNELVKRLKVLSELSERNCSNEVQDDDGGGNAGKCTIQ